MKAILCDNYCRHVQAKTKLLFFKRRSQLVCMSFFVGFVLFEGTLPLKKCLNFPLLYIWHSYLYCSMLIWAPPVWVLPVWVSPVGHSIMVCAYQQCIPDAEIFTFSFKISLQNKYSSEMHIARIIYGLFCVVALHIMPFFCV